MKGSDIGLTILIIFLVFVLMIINVLYIMKAQIEKNWVKYRCNPIVIPFAGFFGKNSMQNFTYCIQNIQKNYMSFILAPTHFNLQTMNATGQQMSDQLTEMTKFISSMRTMFGGVTNGIFGVIMNFFIEIQRLLIGIKDMGGKLLGLVMTLLYLIEGTIMTATSTWTGPVGEAVRAVGRACFAANTSVRLLNGKTKLFKNIALGDILHDGSEVRGLLQLKNWHDKTNMEEWFYTLPNGENGEDILVTGYHLVKFNNNFIYVKDHPKAKLTDYKEKIVYCLVTSTNNIAIGDYVFWDWEDTPQMNKDAERFKYQKKSFKIPSLLKM